MPINADKIIREAAQRVAGVHVPRDRLAQHVGYLQGVVYNLCAQYTGDGAKPQAGCVFYTAIAGDANVLLEYEYSPGEAEQTSGPPERCHEGSPASVYIGQALVNGAWCDPTDVFREELIERWMEKIAEFEDEQARDARESDERSRYDDARDLP